MGETVEGPVCRKCGEVLDDNNWSPSKRRGNHRICSSCDTILTRQWQENNPEKHRSNREKQRERERVMYQEAREVYSGGENCCCFCGQTHDVSNVLARLAIDHINGQGAAHRTFLAKTLPTRWNKPRRKRLASRTVIKFLKTEGWPPGYRVLCNWCNSMVTRLKGTEPITRLHQSKDSGLYDLIHQLRSTDWASGSRPVDSVSQLPTEVK